MMEHIIYKTTNILNNRFYIGMHSTENINDGYLGSGRRITAEIKKYGKENFVKEILEHLPSRDELKIREAEIVCDSLLANPLCLNLKNGGEGGWDHITSEQQSKNGIKGNARMKELRANNPEWNDARSRKHKESAKKAVAEGRITCNFPSWKGKTHSKETKQIIGTKNSAYQTGEGNSQFGTCWVTDGVKPIKIKKDQFDEYLAKGFIKGRKQISDDVFTG